MGTAKEHLTKKQVGYWSRCHLYWKYKTVSLSAGDQKRVPYIFFNILKEAL